MKYALKFPFNIVELSRHVLQAICAVRERCREEALLESVAVCQDTADWALLELVSLC